MSYGTGQVDNWSGGTATGDGGTTYYGRRDRVGAVGDGGAAGQRR